MSHTRLHPRLPIFGVRDGRTHAIYVPGYVMPASARLVAELRHAWRRERCGARVGPAPAAANDLVRAAESVLAAWQARHTGPFAPCCLNLQLPYVCDLACGYCYSRPRALSRPGQQGTINRPGFAAAARLVARHCARQDRPFQLVIQGLGEPTRCWDDLQWCVATTRTAATAAGVTWRGHLSTNGQMDVAQAGWVGRAFSHVTVSCDGPPDIQCAVRPRIDGGDSSARLAGVMGALAAGGGALDARVTVTAANADRLGDVVRYVASALGVRDVHLEPVFMRPSLAAVLPPPAELARRCLDACAEGARLGIEVDVASPRLMELHGGYCEAARQALRVTPAGVAVNCLHGADADCARAVVLGRYDAVADVFRVDDDAAARARADFGEAPSECADCLNRYHCARACPDTCFGLSDAGHDRCCWQRHLAEGWILRATGPAVDAGRRVARVSPAERALRVEVAALPTTVDRELILAGALRAARHYTLENQAMPAPPWEDGGRCLPAELAAERILAAGRDREGAISVYVHLPFCRKKCVFCDCHSVVIARGRAERHAAYVSRIIQDLDVWIVAGGMAGRPVTTVHLGGGTPDAIGGQLLAQLVAAIRSRLNVTAETEWAVETTADGIVPENLDLLLALGFRRVHVGVQTLDDGLRRRLGRRHGGAAAIAWLQAAMAKDIVLSVDLLYGLPDQDGRMLLADLARLADIGIHGLSLYRLNLSSRNRALRRVFPGFQPAPLRACVMLQASEQFLGCQGYRKNHCAHYALPADTDCYFRHAVRGEDLLAVGASAAGAIGSWEYVCAPYPAYQTGDGTKLPITACVQEPFVRNRRLLSVHLMGGWVPAEVLSADTAGMLRGRWLEAGLLAHKRGGYALTATGTWLLDSMLRELRGLSRKKPLPAASIQTDQETKQGACACIPLS